MYMFISNALLQTDAWLSTVLPLALHKDSYSKSSYVAGRSCTFWLLMMSPSFYNKVVASGVSIGTADVCVYKLISLNLSLWRCHACTSSHSKSMLCEAQGFQYESNSPVSPVSFSVLGASHLSVQGFSPLHLEEATGRWSHCWLELSPQGIVVTHLSTQRKSLIS